MRRNQYEEALFRCEDDHFEADVILETTRSAIAQLELLQKELEALEEDGRVQAARGRAVGGADSGDPARVRAQRDGQGGDQGRAGVRA